MDDFLWSDTVVIHGSACSSESGVLTEFQKPLQIIRFDGIFASSNPQGRLIFVRSQKSIVYNYNCDSILMFGYLLGHIVESGITE